MEKISNHNQLEAWFFKHDEQSGRWPQVISYRALMRGLPYGIALNDHNNDDKKLIFSLFRCAFISWNLHRISFHVWADDAARDAVVATRKAADSVANGPDSRFADIGYAAAFAANGSPRPAEYILNTVRLFGSQNTVKAFWEEISFDCNYLLSRPNANVTNGAATSLAIMPVWQSAAPSGWHQHWNAAKDALASIDNRNSYSVWVEWYERRLNGAETAFDIPGDLDREEDVAILVRLAEATDEDFWSKGHEYVNATLKNWLDEARARVAPPSETKPQAENLTENDVPRPISGATAFGLNSEGKLHPLPQYDQQHLRDLPNQRHAYTDVREAALELHEEGQRLGPKLSPKMERFVDAFPERFEDAEAWPIWSAASALRTLYWKHKAVANTREPDDAKLEPAVAVELRGFLDIYNVFAFGDDGLRQKDENSISPQERLKAEEYDKLSQPIQRAIVQTEAIRTEVTLDEIQENLDNIALAVGTAV